MHFRVLKFLVLLTLLPKLAVADLSPNEEERQCLAIDGTLSKTELNSYLYHYLDSLKHITSANADQGITLNEVITQAQFARLADSDKQTTPGENISHWFYFCLHNQAKDTQNLVLTVGPSTLSQVDFYPAKSVLPYFKTGSTKDLGSRDIPNVGFGFRIELAANEKQAFYFRLNTTGYPFYRRANIADNPFFTASLWHGSHFDEQNAKEENQLGIIIGVFLSLLLYNLLLFFSAKQWAPLIHSALILNVFIAFLALKGQIALYAPTGYAVFNNLVVIVTYPLSFLLAALFLRAFIKLKNYPTLNLLANVALVLAVPILVLAYAYDSALFAQLCDLLAILVFAYFGIFVPIYTFIKDRLVLAKYVLITLAPVLLVLVDRALFGFGLSEQYFVPYKIVTAAMLALITQSYFMGLISYQEKQSVLQKANEQLNESNRLKRDYNKQLEKELDQKTADIRSMNADLEAQAQKLIKMDESKSKFFANISHEFRTPLTLIEGPLNSLLDRQNYPDKDLISGVVKHSNSLKGLIDQILLLSELDENSLEIKASELNVVQTVREFVAQFESLFSQKGLSLRCQSERPEIYAYIDPDKLQLIINNLLNNAFKFTQAPGQVTVTIDTTAKTTTQRDFTSDEYVHISVTDTGHGIPADEVDHVFGRYFQSSTSHLSDTGVGTGIGLALVKELVELHAGDVKVESRYQGDVGTSESGTAFHLTLPLGRAHLSDNEIISDTNLNQARPQQIQLSASSGDLEIEPIQPKKAGAATVLIVDDNEDMRRHIRQLLEPSYHTVTAADGVLAEKAIKQQLPDLIVTDLMMPNRNGLEFVQSIRQQQRLSNIPIIMLTARAGMRDRIKGLMASVDDYLVKPFNGIELKLRIKNLLNKQAQFKAFYQTITPSNEVNSDEAVSYLTKVRKTVNQRLQDPDFGVDELARALHVSEATLRRRLSEQANFTPAAFIRHCRLEKARQLCQTGQMRSIEELALTVGFKKASYFSRLYEKTFNQKLELRF